MYINHENAEALFKVLALVGVIGVVVMWFITRTPTHKDKKP